MQNIQEKVENKIIDNIELGASGRLVIIKPEEKGFEDYLTIAPKSKYKEKSINFRIIPLVIPSESLKFVKDFLKESFFANERTYLVFSYFNKPQQKVENYVWLVPTLEFLDIAENIKNEDGKDILRFESIFDLEKKDKYSGFLVKTKNLGKLIIDAYKNKGQFDFERSGIKSKKEINFEELKNFLYTARLQTYASGEKPVENPQSAGSKQFKFQKGDYFYRDIFFSGDNRFIGQEIIYLDSKPIWVMNYIGNQLGKIETDFLKFKLF
jgi:hypothetical protein